MNLKTENDNSVILYTSNDKYTLSKFERPESAVSFLQNYWNLVRKDNLSRSGQLNENRSFIKDYLKAQNISIHHPSFNHLYNKLFLGDGTSGQNGTNTSEAASDGNECVTKKIHAYTTNSVPSQSSSSSLAYSPSPNEQLSLNTSKSSIPMICMGPNSANRCDPTSTNHLIVSSTTNNTASSSSLTTSNTDSVGRQRAVFCDERKDSQGLISYLSMKNLNQTFNINTKTSTNNNDDRVQNSVGNVQKKIKTNYSQKFKLSVLNVCQFFFTFSFLNSTNSSAQKFTMFIAYTILGFLFLSTMHLYHRLVIVDLHTGPTMKGANFYSSDEDKSSSFVITPPPGSSHHMNFHRNRVQFDEEQFELQQKQAQASFDKLKVSLEKFSILIGQLSSNVLDLKSELDLLISERQSLYHNPPFRDEL